jgi:hypothetical protein
LRKISTVLAGDACNQSVLHGRMALLKQSLKRFVVWSGTGRTGCQQRIIPLIGLALGKRRHMAKSNHRDFYLLANVPRFVSMGWLYPRRRA